MRVLVRVLVLVLVLVRVLVRPGRASDPSEMLLSRDDGAISLAMDDGMRPFDNGEPPMF